MSWLSTKKKPDTVTDHELLLRYRETGDLAVLAQLYQQYNHSIYYVCYRYLQDAEQSKDAVMQIFEELIHKVNKHDIKQFSSWLHVLSRNYCLMQRRSAKKMQHTSIDDFMELPADLHLDHDNKETQLSLLELCMKKLTSAQKHSVELFFLNEKCYKEITDITGYTLNEVKSYIQNGKRNLKICMEKNSER
ncbi:MAG: sigma-70 family RNA polymerase sigma factor [Bacteroidota bacterium]